MLMLAGRVAVLYQQASTCFRQGFLILKKNLSHNYETILF